MDMMDYSPNKQSHSDGSSSSTSRVEASQAPWVPSSNSNSSDSSSSSRRVVRTPDRGGSCLLQPQLHSHDSHTLLTQPLTQHHNPPPSIHTKYPPKLTLKIPPPPLYISNPQVQESPELIHQQQQPNSLQVSTGRNSRSPVARVLSPELRHHLKECLETLLAPVSSSPTICEDNNQVFFNTTHPEDHLQDLSEEADTSAKSFRQPWACKGLVSRSESVSSDYFSDAGEGSWHHPSLEYVEEEIPPNSDKSNRQSGKDNPTCQSGIHAYNHAPRDQNHLDLLKVESDNKINSVSSSDTRDSVNSVQTSECKVNLNPEANISAKHDFRDLVPETRFSSVKSLCSSTTPPIHSTSFPYSCTSSVIIPNCGTTNTSCTSSSPSASFSVGCSPSKSVTTSTQAYPGVPSVVLWHPPVETDNQNHQVDDQDNVMDMDKEIGGLKRLAPGLHHAVGVAPLSFSLSSLYGSSSAMLEASGSPVRIADELTTNSLNRRKIKRCGEREAARRSWGPADKEEGNREFWASIQEPYDYIMGNNLITDSCQVGTNDTHSSGEFELSWDSGDVSPPYVWSFSEFLDQYNELYEWLIQVQLKLYTNSSNLPDKSARMAQQEELRRRTFRRKLFVEQGERVAQRYPNSAEEISWRVNYLNNKWDQLENSFATARGRCAEVEVELDLAHEEGILKRWLSDMEEQIQPITCRLPRGCSVLTLQDKYKDNQILLKDIEAHGPVVKSVVRQYERVAVQEAQQEDEAQAGDRQPPQQEEDSVASSSAPPAAAAAPQPTPSSRKASKGPPRKARSLEKRWHQIYLRSLEWHYYLEGVIANFKDQVWSSGCSSSEDEPVNKIRRVSGGSSTCSTCPPSSPLPPGYTLDSAYTSTPLHGDTHHLHPNRSPHHSRAWSDSEINLSEAGSYIEDDYVCVTESLDEDAARLNGIPTPPEPMIIDSHTPITEVHTKSDSNELQSSNAMVGSAAQGTTGPAIEISLSPSMMPEKSPTITTDTIANENIHHHVENNNQLNGNILPQTMSTNSGVISNPAYLENSVKTVKDSPSRSSCTRVERPSPNCAIFDFKHNDSDNDETPITATTSTSTTTSTQANLNLVECDPSRNRVYQVRRSTQNRTRNARTRLEFSGDEEVDHEALQQIIDSAILDPNWLVSKLPSDLEFSEEEGSQIHETMDTGSDTPIIQSQQQEGSNKDSITRLVCDAEKLVREPSASGEPEGPLISPRPQQLSLNNTSSSKQARVRHWLATQRRDARLSFTCVLDSCDASGELTTGESDVESGSSEEMDASTATHKGSIRGSLMGSHKGSHRGSRDPLPSSDNTPTADRNGSFTAESSQNKVVLRSRKRRSGESRPLSVTELSQIALRLDTSPLSVSETALHNIMAGTPETPTNDNQLFGETVGECSVVTSSSFTDMSPGQFSEPNPSVSTPSGEVTTPTNSPESTLTQPSSGGTVPPLVPYSSLLSMSTTSNTSIASAGRVSPTATGGSAVSSLRRRRTKARRKSNLSLGRRTDSGSESVALNPSGSSDNQISPNRRHSKSHSSGSDTNSYTRRQPPYIVKSESFTGIGGISQRNGCGGMTSSTERCVSDTGCVVGVPRPYALDTSLVCSSSEDERPASPAPVPVVAPPPIRELVPPKPPSSTLSTPRSSYRLSDQDNTNTGEDMSSLSEQAWDPYQENKYLSENYSEDFDQDAARRLLDFGDDYRKYIDSDGASSFSGVSYSRGRRNSPVHTHTQRRQRVSGLAQAPRDLDSDSDLDDLHHVIDESRSQLQVTENVLKKYSNEAALGLDYGELVATTQTNLKCLAEILRHLKMEGSLDAELKEVQGIVQRWEVLQAQAVERQRQSGQVRELQRQVKSLRVSLESLRDRATHPHHRHDSLDTHDQLANSLQELKEIANEVASRKSDVSSINLAVHRFLTDTGYNIAPLKDDVADLYRLWDEVHSRVSNEVARLEGVESTWRLWEAQAAELRQALRQDQDTLAVLDQAIQTGSISDSLNASAQDVARLLNDRRKTQPAQAKKIMLQHTRTQGVDIAGSVGSSLIGEDCASDSGTSGYESCSSEELSERERRLAHLRRLARDLEASLSPQSEAWASITKTLSTAENELRGLQKHCRELVVRSAENLEQVKPSPVTRRRSWNKERGSRTSRVDKRSSVGSDKNTISKRGWMWRVVRAALPFQAALLLLFCVACLLEPNCCDHVNTLNLSFSPQTRYVHGPPPV